MDFTFDIPEAALPQERGLRVRFYKKSKEDKTLTKQNGIPTHVMVDYVEINVPGDRTNVIDRPVRDEDKAKFAPQWRAYLAQTNQDEASGTPLSVLGLFPQSRIDDLKYHGIVTAEQYAAVNDDNITRLGPTARREQTKVKDCLAAAKSRAPFLQLQAQVDQKDKRIASLEMQVKELVARMNGTPMPAEMPAMPAEIQATPSIPAPTKRRGRPRKVKTEEVSDAG